MKKLLFILTVLFSLGASAQTMVYDTTIVKTPLNVVRTGGSVKDSLVMPAATTSVNGYMTAAAMTELAALAGGSPVFPVTNTRSSSYTIQTSDFNKMINVATGTNTTVTLPAGLPDGFSCRVIQGGGVITFVAGAGVSIRSAYNYRRTQIANAVVTIVNLGNNTYSISGNLRQ
jgi:hypothetical protein